jgi:hypothetical protein
MPGQLSWCAPLTQCTQRCSVLCDCTNWCAMHYRQARAADDQGGATASMTCSRSSILTVSCQPKGRTCKCVCYILAESVRVMQYSSICPLYKVCMLFDSNSQVTSTSKHPTGYPQNHTLHGWDATTRAMAPHTIVYRGHQGTSMPATILVQIQDCIDQQTATPPNMKRPPPHACMTLHEGMHSMPWMGSQ